ncbi:hypothetical protein Tco_0583957 [Tanacetum coccineum]
MGCEQPCIGLYCYLCTCQQCGFSLSNGTCINCTYGDGKLVTCCECESPLNGGFCLFCNSRAGNSSAYDPNPNSYNDSPNFSDYTPQPQYQPILYEFCRNDARYGHYCTPQVPIISNPKPCNNQTVDELPQTLPSFYPTCYSRDGNSFTYDSTPNFVDDSPNVFNPPPQPPTYSYEICGNDAHYGHDCPPQVPFIYNPEHCPSFINLLKKQVRKCCKLDVQIISEEMAAYVNTPSWNCPIVYCNEDDDEEYTITVTPDLSTKEPDNSLSMGDEHLDTIPKTELDEVIKSSVEDLVLIQSEFEGIFDNMCDVPCCDKNHLDAESDLIESLLNQDTLIIHSLKIDSLLEEFAGELAPINPIPSGIFPEKDIRLVEQLLYDDTSSDDDSYEDIDYVDASPPDSELVSLEEVKDFHTENGEIEDDILRDKLSKINLLIAKIEALNTNLTQSSDFVTKIVVSVPLLVRIILFRIMKLSNDLFPLADRSDFYHGEFTDELAHIISPSEYDCFYFKSEPDPGELTSIVDSEICENVLSTTNVNLPFEDDQSPLFTYVVWIFLPFLTYPVTPPYLLLCGNENTIFDPGISIYHSFMPSVSHWSGTFMKFNDCPDYEASRARGSCPSFTRASNPQLYFGNPIS